MRILQLHNRYQRTGGEEGVVYAEKALLESKGHVVSLVEVDNNEIQGWWTTLQVALSTIYSHKSLQLAASEIRAFQPDIVHVHNFFPQLSPSVYKACQLGNVPVVQTLHNYRLACPKAMFFREGTPCEACLGAPLIWPSVFHGCYRNSRLQSVVVASMLTWHNWKKTWHNQVDAYIVLTQFQKDKMCQAGLSTQKLHVKSNFISNISFDGDNDSRHTSASQRFILFVGRLSEEKGISVLIKGYLKARVQMPLKIVGEGPLRSSLESLACHKGGGRNIDFLGWKPKRDVLSLMKQAYILVFPSVWYEGFPLTIAEAFSCKLPVLVSNLGSMAEIVEEHITGLHFSANSSEDLSRQLRWSVDNPDKLDKMRSQAHRAYKTRYSAEINYNQLIGIYHSLIAQKNLSNQNY